MPWIQIRLNSTGADAEAIGDELTETGAVSVTFQDSHDTPIFEPLPGKPACGVIPTLSVCMTPKRI